MPAKNFFTRILPVAAIAAGLLVAAPAADAGKKKTRRSRRRSRSATSAPVKARAAAKKPQGEGRRSRAQNTDVLPTRREPRAGARRDPLPAQPDPRREGPADAASDNAKLRKAAARPLHAMVNEGYFDHTSPNGDTFVDRILGAGYAKRNDAWTLGENLAWGTGDLSTPAGIMQSWMNSAGHKANILKRPTARSASASASACRATTASAPPSPPTSAPSSRLRPRLGCDGRRRTASRTSLRPRAGRRAAAGRGTALRRDRRGPASRARGPLAVQRRRGGPAAERRRHVRARGRGARPLARARASSPATTSPRCGRWRRSTPGPDGETRTRHGVFARVRVEDYGPGRIRPHERTHPGPKEDRLRLTRATRANLSPIFSLFDDPDNAAWGALEPHLDAEPVGRGDRRGRHASTACGGSTTPTRSTTYHDGAARHRAADRRRPPPLRDRARVPAGGAERRPRADVPGRAAGLRPDRVPDAPARGRT